MARNEDKRNFALRTSDGDETSVFSGGTPRQAALKAPRRLDPADSEDDADEQDLRLREKGTRKVHIYEGWAWVEEAPDDKPDWMPGDITKGNVSKAGRRTPRRDLDRRRFVYFHYPPSDGAPAGCVPGDIYDSVVHPHVRGITQSDHTHAARDDRLASSRATSSAHTESSREILICDLEPWVRVPYEIGCRRRVRSTRLSNDLPSE